MCWLFALTLVLHQPSFGCAKSVTYPESSHFDGDKFHNEAAGRSGGVDGRALVATDGRCRSVAGLGADCDDETRTRRPTRRGTGNVHQSQHVLDSGGRREPTHGSRLVERVSPFGFIGPKRHHAPGVRFEDLPPIDAVVVSHDHYDHLDQSTIAALTEHSDPRIFVGLGQERHLTGIPANVTALDWWQCTRVKGIEVCAVPAQHNSRRGAFDANETLWVGYWINAPSGSFYFAGDTGAGPHFEQIRTRFGAPCIALLPIGAYLPRWFMAPNHISPADAVEAHDTLRATTSIAMHFGTFRQADDGMYQPIVDLRTALERGNHAPFLVPTVGKTFQFRCPREYNRSLH